MNVLLIVSSNIELNAIAKTFPVMECLNNNRFVLKSESCQLQVLNVGTGMVAMTYWLTCALREDFDLVVNAGICGAFNMSLLPGDVIVVEEDLFADLGRESQDGFLDLFDLGLADKNEYPFSEGRIKHHPGSYSDLFAGFKKQYGITVNSVSTTKERIQLMRQKYSPDVESMEGAAFFYVCMNENLNFVQLRAVSNYVEPGNRSEWKVEEALGSLSSTLYKIFK